MTFQLLFSSFFRFLVMFFQYYIPYHNFDTLFYLMSPQKHQGEIKSVAKAAVRDAADWTGSDSSATESGN